MSRSRPASGVSKSRDPNDELSVLSIPFFPSAVWPWFRLSSQTFYAWRESGLLSVTSLRYLSTSLKSREPSTSGTLISSHRGHPHWYNLTLVTIAQQTAVAGQWRTWVPMSLCTEQSGQGHSTQAIGSKSSTKKWGSLCWKKRGKGFWKCKNKAKRQQTKQWISMWIILFNFFSFRIIQLHSKSSWRPW